MVYYLNDKGLHDFGKRMIISKLLGGGGYGQCCRSGGSLGGGAPPSTLENREFIMSQRRFSHLAILNTECTHVQERQEKT